MTPRLCLAGALSAAVQASWKSKGHDPEDTGLSRYLGLLSFGNRASQAAQGCMVVVDDPGLVGTNVTGLSGAHRSSWIQSSTCQKEGPTW